jgi:hypothetical protein
MHIRQIQEQDKERLMSWLVNQPWPLPPVKDGMSRYGFVVGDEEGDVVFGHVYLTETGYAFLDWLGLNPDRSFEDHRKAALTMFGRIEGMFGALNAEPRVSCLVFYTRIEWLADALKDNGYHTKRHFIQCTKLIK